MEKLFMSNGFQVKIVTYEEIAESLGVVLPSQVYHGTVMFIAQQLRLSDDHVIASLNKDTPQLSLSILCN
ncbi:unnamed protein product [Eruca vesicaria subsp. sativa]|uniref:Uncharacterized protein n=1 Tax=Eruca vesicaria subsp. sativa TaxID=29727 RepID=A0ABC8K438_ERUVS|nr:unnamed protein product [Eruca vesicaria subsp. sativa]